MVSPPLPGESEKSFFRLAGAKLDDARCRISRSADEVRAAIDLISSQDVRSA